MSVASRRQLQALSDVWLALGISALLILGALTLRAYVMTPPETMTVSRHDIAVFLPLDGVVMAPPTARAEIAAPYRAPVARVYASVGERVRKGAVLVELSLPSAQAAYEQARRELLAAEAAYAKAKRQYTAQVEAARKELEIARVAEQRALQAAAAREQSTGAGATNAAATDTATTDTVVAPLADVATATAARITAEQALLQTQQDMEQALAPYRQRLEAARRAFLEAQAGRKQAFIRAPIDGTVLTLNARPGVVIGEDPKTPVATIVDLNKLQVQAPMKPEEADSVRAGETATLTFKELPGRQFEGKVSSITTEAAPLPAGQRYIALIDFKNDEGIVKPDMVASVALKLGEARNVLAVPSEAIKRDRTGRPYVEVLRNGRWQRVVVETGLSDGRYTAIRSGLKDGQIVRVPRDLLS